MEQMMGVKEGLPDALAAELAAHEFRAGFKDASALSSAMAALVRHHFGCRETSARFYRTAQSRARPAPARTSRPCEAMSCTPVTAISKRNCSRAGTRRWSTISWP